MTGKKRYPICLERYNFAAKSFNVAANFMWNQCVHFHQNMIQTTLNYSH